MWVAPCSWRTRINLILESTSASKIGIAAPPDSPNIYSTPSRSRQRISFSAPVVALRSAGAAAEDFFDGALAGFEAGAGLWSEVGTADLLVWGWRLLVFGMIRDEVDETMTICRLGQQDLGSGLDRRIEM